MKAVGYEIVEGYGGQVKGLYSFTVKIAGRPVKDLTTPLWFHTKAAARGCAEDCLKKLTEHLRERLRAKGIHTKVEKYRG